MSAGWADDDLAALGAAIDSLAAAGHGIEPLNTTAAGPVQVVISWPATIYVTVEVAADGTQRIVGSEVMADDSGVEEILGRVHDVRRVDAGLAPVPEGGRFADAALAFVAEAQWPNPTLTA